MGSADHASSGGSPHVPLSLLHVSKLWICRFLAACGPMNPCEAEWHALIGGRHFPWIVECVSLLLKCVFCLISPAYKYLPTLMEVVGNKPLPLC